MAEPNEKPGAALGRALVALRQTATYVCEYCGKEFATRRSDRNPPRFCSASHRAMAFNREKRAAAKVAKQASADPPPRPEPAGAELDLLADPYRPYEPEEAERARQAEAEYRARSREAEERRGDAG